MVLTLHAQSLVEFNAIFWEMEILDIDDKKIMGCNNFLADGKIYLAVLDADSLPAVFVVAQAAAMDLTKATWESRADDPEWHRKICYASYRLDSRWGSKILISSLYA
jgi:hypothetical protein